MAQARPEHEHHKAKGFSLDVSRSNFGDMLWDFERNYLYKLAIQKTVRRLLLGEEEILNMPSTSSGRCHQRRHGKLELEEMRRKILKKNWKEAQTWRFLDIGTGTGLLSMFAARVVKDIQMQRLLGRGSQDMDKVDILALEEQPETADCAIDVIATNRFEDMVFVANVNSTTCLPQDGFQNEKADFLYAELYDTELIGECALLSYRHAQLEQIKPDALLVPCRARIYVQAVSSPVWNGMHHYKEFRYRYPRSYPVGEFPVRPPAAKKNCPGLMRSYETQINQLRQVRFVSEVVEAFSFDFTKDLSTQMKGQRFLQLPLFKRAFEGYDPVALIFWWETDLDKEGEYKISNAPYWARMNVDYGKLLHSEECEIVYEGLRLTGIQRNPNLNTPSRYFEDLKALNKFLRGFSDMPKPTYVERLERMYERIGQKMAWRDHWMQVVHLLPSKILYKDDTENLNLMAFHDEYEFWFRIASDSEKEQGIMKLAKYRERGDYEKIEKGPVFGPYDRYNVCRCPAHPKMMANRNRMIGDFIHHLDLLRNMHLMIPTMDGAHTIVILAAAHYLPVYTAALYPESKIWVYPLEHPNSYEFYESLIETNGIKDRVTICKDLKTIKNLKRPIDMLVFDPYIEMKALEFHTFVKIWKHLDEVRGAREHIGIDERFLLLPGKCKIKFTLVTFDHLWKLHMPVEKIDGFDLRPFARMIRQSSETTDDQLDHYMLTEYPAVCVLERSFTLYEFDFSQPFHKAPRKRFSFELDVRKLERDFLFKFGRNPYNMYEQRLDGLYPFVREFSNLAILYWSEFDQMPTSGPTSPIQYLEPVHCSEYYYQGVTFLTEYSMNQTNHKRPKYEFDLNFTLDLHKDMKLKISYK